MTKKIIVESKNVIRCIIDGISRWFNKIRYRKVKCLGYQCTFPPIGVEYDCGYEAEVECSECVCTGGRKDPRLRKYKINEKQR